MHIPSEISQYEKATWRLLKKKKIVFAKGEEGRRINRQSTEDFQGNETILYNTIMVGTCHYIFVKIRRFYNTRNELQCKK